ncbi:hypothetical protein TRFO_17537 [Tritrichomonas foetus]|uniref:CCR4-Not complex component Not1 C-terminal domain-containing protein n=1 Tax=Tritrichomonas foetus TaxID=1144522 RepID=A0A1J4KSQ9_9EUKA|nr:hypothetical protein TRFO_17537 [Tritrichomonas foetus]|eukprot:OHT12509.1 hypothetical protein TRFO_17537 [Tritrichomonas foetus]
MQTVYNSIFDGVAWYKIIHLSAKIIDDISKSGTMSKIAKHFPPPSPLALGSLYVEKLLRVDSANDHPNLVVNRVISILETTNLLQLKSIMTIIFHTLQDSNSSEKQKGTMKIIIKEIIHKFQTHSHFRPHLIALFDSLPNFPVNLIQSLSLENGIILCAYGCFSRYAQIAKLFLKQKLLPSATEEMIANMNQNTLFEITSLSIENQFIKARLKKLSSCYIPNLTNEGKDDPQNIKVVFQPKDRPSLFDAVLESDARALTNSLQLRRLFDFFPEFDATHAALFITSISCKKCCFRAYFSRLEETQRERIIDLFRESFIERKVDLKLITNNLDQPNTLPLDNEGCSLLFMILHGLLKNSKIPAKPFLGKWQNLTSQLQFATFLANNQINNLSFDNCKLTKLHGYETPPTPNNCWLCIDFVECVLDLAYVFPREITQLLSIASDQYSAPLLLTYSQLGKHENELFRKSTVSFITTIIQSRHTSQIIDILWKTNNQFCMWIFSVFYYQYPNKLNNIIDAIGDHLNELLLSDDLKLVIDLAFQASLRGLVEIDVFIKQLVDRTSIDVLTNILMFVKSMVLDSSLSSPALFSGSLNTMFKYFWNIFDNLNSNLKLLVNTVYSICDSSVPNIKKVPFADSLPSIKTPEVKESASELFTKFFTDQLSVSQFVQLFHQHRVNSQMLFQSMEHYLILELKYLDQHDVKDIQKLGQLIGNMVHENLFNEKQLKIIFQVFVKAFSSTIYNANYKFSVPALDICYPKLATVPQAVFSILKQPLLKNSQPQLYEKIKKLSTNLATPVHLAKSTSLTLHPRLKKFEKLSTPPPRVCKLIQQIPNDPCLIHSIITSYKPYIEWLALHLVSTIQDKPVLLLTLLNHLLEAPQFTRIVIQAAIFESIQLITSPQFSTFEGAFTRRRLSILGQLIGQLTLAVNRTISGRFLDLKHLLLYAFSQGKLFGVVPFVSNILCVASPYFNPPNPYTSAILQVLASIAMTDLLKLYIKNQIYQIFNHFNVSLSQIKLLSLVPDIRQGNFDFVAPPFALNYILSVTDIDRIIQFDENVFATLAAQNVVIPDPPNPSQSRDKMRTSITAAALAFLKQDGTTLAKVASSTAGDLILKDFMFSNNVELMQETAATLTKQLAAGLTLFTVFQKLQRFLSHQMLHDFGQVDMEWINATIQANINWIGQMLHDVVHLKALKIVQQRIEQNEEIKRTQGPRYIEAISQSSQRNLPPVLAPNEQGLTVQHRQIYQDLAELPLSPAELSFPELVPDKTIKPNEMFEKFFSKLYKLISNEIQQNTSAGDPLDFDSPFYVMMNNFPEIKPVFEEFLSILRVMMKYMAKVTHSINDRIYGFILQKVVEKVPQPFVTRAQPYVAGWLRNSIPSVSLLCDLMGLGLITTAQLDRFFFDSLNKQPFNYRLYMFAIRFLQSTLVKQQLIQPSEMISSLTLVVSTPISMLETAASQQQEFINELRKVLDELEVPLHVLSPESKLQTMATFDPIEDISEVDTIIASFNKWKNVVEDDNANDDTVLKITKEMFELGRDFFVIVLLNGNKEDINRILRCAKECNILKGSWESIAASFEYCIGGNSMVLEYDMKKYFDALIALLDVVYDDIELLTLFAALLHCLRPLLMPSFTFSWIQLISERQFVYNLISNKLGWSAMTTLLADYVVTVSFTVDTNHHDVFDLLYKSLLRFVLVLIHDFPDFLVAIVPELVTLLPTSFTQLRNILLSATSYGIKTVTITSALKSLDKVPGIDEFISIPVPQKHLIEKLQFANAIKSEIAFTELASQLEKRASNGAIASFVVFVTNVLLPQSSASQILSPQFSSIHVYFIVTELIKKLGPEAIVVLVNVIIDQLRYPCKTTLFFFKTALTLLRTEIKQQIPVSLEEIIIKTVMERAVTPPPHPWGLRLLIRELVTSKDFVLLERPYVSKSEDIQNFLKAITETFCNDD